MKSIKIVITITEDSITLNGDNFNELTTNDIIDSIGMLISFNKTLSILQEGEPANGNA